MASQQLVDSLTDHIALYHVSSSSSSSNPNHNPRSAVLRWFSALSASHRRSVLTVVDPDFVRVLLLMLSRLRSLGGAHARFFLLPDLPNPSTPSLPSICFRRSDGLLARVAAADPHSPSFALSLLLFSSLHETDLDSITVSEGLVENVEHFLEVMDGISGGRFLRGEEAAAELGKPWVELPWLRDKGYYSIEAFVANKLEVALRLSWLNSAGGKKHKGSRGKEKERATGVAGAAANAFWRKKGCVDWWMGLDAGVRKDFIVTFLGKTAKCLERQIAKESDIDLSNKTFSFDTKSKWLLRDGLTAWHSLFKRERNFCSDTISLPSSVMPHAIPDSLKRLVAIQEISAMFLACQRKELEKDILFFSTLGSVHTVSDFIFRKLRAVIMMVSVDIIKAELMGDDEKLKTIEKKTEEKFVLGHRRGKNKYRKPKNLNPTPKPSMCDLELHETSVDNEYGTHFVEDNSFRSCPELNSNSMMNDEKKRVDSACTIMQKDPGKDNGTCMVDWTDKKKGRKKGAKSKTSSIKEPVKVGNPELENYKTDNSSFDIEKEPAKPIGSIGASTIDPISNTLVVRDELPPSFSCNALNYPVTMDHTDVTTDTQVDNILYSTTDSCVGIQDFCLNKNKLGDSDIFNHVSSCLIKDKEFKLVTPLCPVPTKYCCDKLTGHYVDTSIRCSSGLTPSGDISGPTRELENATKSKVPVHHISPSISCSISQSVAPQNLLQPAINNQSTVIQSASRACYVYDHSASIGGPSYEWPIIAPLNFTSVNSRHLPPATDRLHLDVGHSWPNHLRQSYPTLNHQARSSLTEGACGRILPSLTLPMSYDWPLMVKTCSRLSQSVTVGYDSGYTSRMQSSFSGFSTQGVQINGNSSENCMTHSKEYMDAYDSKIASELADETESYWLSEEEYDARAFSGQDYNQVFGGGVMYWNTSEYVGTGFSRPPSYSSEDSSWAWREADLNRAIDDMVGMPGVSAAYNTNGLSSPPAGPFCSPFDPLVGSGHQSVGYAMPGNDVAGQILHSSSSISDGQEEKLSRSLNNPSGGVEGMKGDTLPYQRLRPIIVPSISRKGSRSDFKLSHDHKSPCLPSSIRDPPRLKRPPSPVVLCVPRVPRPPPPSPVGESRKRGFPSVRSGSSSPRQWGVRSWYQEEGHSEEPCLPLDGTEVVWPSWGKKSLNAAPMVQSIKDSMLQNHLLTISQISRDQEHPDVAFPVQCPDIPNSPSHSLSTLHTLLHEEIDCFCKQVAAENLIRKPYINWAVKRVTRSLQVLWPRSRTNIFGSNATSLALPTSDLDLVISLPPVRNLEPIKEAGILEGRNGIKETCLQHAARYLANQEWVRNDSLKTIENTAIPVIMLVAEVPHDVISSNGTSSIVDTTGSQSIEIPTEQTIVSHSDAFGSEDNSVPASSNMRKDGLKNVKSIHLDISFKSPSHTGLQTSELVRELTQQFPASVPLALVLKQFLADRSLDRSYSGGLSSYCLILLITRFLQHEHHVGRPINQNLGGLLMDFLYFFGNVFDPRQMRISIHGTGVYMKRERGLSIDPIHIDDPLHPTNNVGRNCFRIHQCVKAFADAYSVLENELSQLSYDCGTTSRPSFRILPKIIPSID